MKETGMSINSKVLNVVPLDTIGINGLDSQTNPTALGATWFTKADNIVYTEGGKVTFRKGLKQMSLNGGAKIGSMVEHYNGTVNKIFGAVSGNIYELDLTDKDLVFTNVYATGGSVSDWQFQNFNNELIAFQSGLDILHYESSSWGKIKDDASYTAPAGVTTFDPSCGLGYYGRVWAGGITEEKDVLYYSDLLDAHKWSTGSSGGIDLKTVWGHDEIVAIHPYAGKLAIFGKENIVLYNFPDEPTDMALDEVIRGIGCISRDSIQAIGNDLYFLSDTGVKSLIRTAESDKLPLKEMSVTVKDEIIAHIKASKNVKSAYYYAEGLYLLSFVDRNVTYVFDLQYLTADKQTPRVTKWTFADNRHPASLIYSEDYGLLVGQHTGRVAGYEGYYDVDYDGSSVYTSNPYTGSLSTVWMSLSPDLERASILKRLIMVISGGQGTDIGLRLYKDFELSPKLSPTFKLNPALSGVPALWGVAKYPSSASPAAWTSDKYAPIHGLKEHSVPLSGSAKYLRIEMDGVTKGYKASLQSLALLFKHGKTR
jgi:hypothetical protein